MNEREVRHVQIRDALVDLASRPSMEEWVDSATDRGWGVDRDMIRNALDDVRRGADAR